MLKIVEASVKVIMIVEEKEKLRLPTEAVLFLWSRLKACLALSHECLLDVLSFSNSGLFFIRSCI